MRIQHNIMAMNAYRNYNTNTSAISKNLEKLSSGYKINRAGDDAAGLAVSQKMRLQIAGLEQAQKNAKSGISYVQTAEGALQEVHDMIERIYTLAEQSANGTFDVSTDRTQLQKEVNSLLTEIKRIGETANFNGIGIFQQYKDGENIPQGANGAAFWIGPETIGEETADDAANKMSIGQLNLSLENISIENEDVESGVGVEGVYSSVPAGSIATIDITTADNAINQLTLIKTASNAVSNMRGSLGAIQNRLDHTIKNLSVMQENMQDAESVIRDTDVADEMMKYTKNNILIQSSQAMLAQANQIPQGVLQLLQ